MSDSDVRWKQRLSNYDLALQQLSLAVAESKVKSLSNLEKQGLIQAFEFTHELAWNLLRDYFVYQGNTQISGSRDATREGFQKGLIKNGDVWMEMIKSRNQTSHTYNKTTADDIAHKVIHQYFDCFCQLQTQMQLIANK